MDNQLLAFVGIFLGCFARAILPFLKKLNQQAEAENPPPWKWRYCWSGLVALLVSGIAAMVVLPSFQIPDAGMFPLACAFGWAATDVLNTMIS